MKEGQEIIRDDGIRYKILKVENDIVTLSTIQWDSTETIWKADKSKLNITLFWTEYDNTWHKIYTYFSTFLEHQLRYVTNESYHESLDNLTPADIYLRKFEEVMTRRKEIKLKTMVKRRKLNLHLRKSLLAFSRITDHR